MTHSSEPIAVRMPTMQRRDDDAPDVRGLKNDPMVTGCPLAMSSRPPM